MVGELLSLNSSRMLAWALAGVPYFGSAATSASASGMESFRLRTSLARSRFCCLSAACTLASRPDARSHSMNRACARFSGRPAARSTSWMKASRTLSIEPAPSVPAAARSPPSGLARLLSSVSMALISAGKVTSERAVAPSSKR